jgi:hypothetical protein
VRIAVVVAILLAGTIVAVGTTRARRDPGSPA